MKTITLPDGTAVPALGQGTWMMAEQPSRRGEEIQALQAGIDLGMTLVDTAEMYADGASEELVGEAVAGRRDQVFLVSKAYPQNASRDRLPRACDGSLKRLGTDRLDLYLLHWRGAIPLDETVEAMERLVAAGKILRWGVSNLDTEDMAELVSAGGAACATDQILYNLTRRGPEHDLLPWLFTHNMTAMAYSPIEQGRLVANRELAQVAAEIGVTPTQVALAWTIRSGGVIAIPKASRVSHIRDNRAAADLELSATQIQLLDRAFPQPHSRVPLEML